MNEIPKPPTFSDGLVIAEYNLAWVKPTQTISLIAPRGSGKSFFARDICYNLRRIPVAIVISGSEKFNHDYGDFIPDSNIFDKFTPNILKSIYDRQEDLDYYSKKYAHVFRKYNINPSILVVADDCMYDSNKWSKDEETKYMFFNGRHAGATFLYTLQDPMGLPRAERENTDVVAVGPGFG